MRATPATPSGRAPRSAVSGFNLLELLIGLAVLGILAATGLPSLTAWIQNSQIRTAADGLMSGLQLARAEALRRNASVRFQLTSTLTSGCALSTTGKNWVVSLADPSGACDADASDTTAPQIIQSKSSAEGTANAILTAGGGAVATFNGLGRLTGAGLTQVDISNTIGGSCQGTDGVGGGPMRCLRVTISTGGNVRLCDPAVSSTSDPRFCS